MNLSPHFTLEELIPPGPTPEVPAAVLAALELLTSELLEPLRLQAGAAVVVHCGWRPKIWNELAGGVSDSDHLAGNAADIHVVADRDRTWEENTLKAFHWLRQHRIGRYGQLILEDQRQWARVHAQRGWPGRMWIHVANVTAKHPGIETDPNRLLVSSAPRQYARWQDATA